MAVDGNGYEGTYPKGDTGRHYDTVLGGSPDAEQEGQRETSGSERQPRCRVGGFPYYSYEYGLHAGKREKNTGDCLYFFEYGGRKDLCVV